MPSSRRPELQTHEKVDWSDNCDHSRDPPLIAKGSLVLPFKLSLWESNVLGCNVLGRRHPGLWSQLILW